MRRTITAVALAASVLAPSSALAECAWVLWQRSIDRNHATAWEPVSGGNEPGCPRAPDASLAAERQVATFTQIRQDTTRWTVMKKDDQNTPAVTKMYEYRCLPDTVDPRGPRGK